MKSIVLITLCLLCLTGCNEKSSNLNVSHTIKYDNVSKTNSSIEDIDYPEIDKFVYDENARYEEAIIDSNFKIRVKDTGSGIVVGNSEKEDVLTIDELSKGIVYTLDFLYNSLYKCYTIQTGSVEWYDSDYLVDKGYVTINNKEWFYFVQKHDFFNDVYLTYTDVDSHKDFVIETQWITDDVELIMNNIEVLLTELDLQIVDKDEA